MDQIFITISSTGFRNAMYSLAIVGLLLAIGITVIAFAFYGRTREMDNASPDDEKWTLLFATWRDSLIITLLFTAEGFVYKYGDFYGFSEVTAGNIFLFAPIVVPILSFVLELLIFVITALRIIAISRWLSSRSG